MDTYQNQPNPEVKDIRFAEPTFIDPLTRIYNQYYLFQFLPEEIKKAQLGNYPLAVFMIDLDGFKYVNDTFGHLCGDEVLKQMAEILKKSVRQTDMVIRYAGDEFTILLPGVDQKKVEKLAQALVDNVAKTPFKGLDGQDLHLTISMGFSLYPDDGDRVDTLIELADKALYLSKQKGKNRVSQAKEATIEAVSSLVAMDSFPCPKFIDRKEEIDKLRNTFDASVLKSHTLQLALISGDSGIGKSRLLLELNNYVQDRAVVISCSASLVHKQDPYFLFARGMSLYLEKIGIHNPQLVSLLARVPLEELAELGRLIPPIASLVKKQSEVTLEEKQARFLLFKGFLDLLIEFNKFSPVVFLFDDVHWSDKASIELLRYLNKQERNKQIFVVCCVSEDKYQAMTEESNLKGLLEEALFVDNFLQIKLTYLSLNDAVEMIEAIFPGVGKNTEFCQSVYHETQGNPSFIEEILKSLVENATLIYQDNCWQIKKGSHAQGAPFSLEEMIKKRLRSIDEETKEMIVQAAVIGEDFSVDFLKKIDKRDEGFMLELLERAKKMHLIGEAGKKGKFGFINKNIQNMLYNELNEEDRHQLHQKVVKALREEHKDNLDNVAGEMAFHYSHGLAQDKSGEYSKTLEKTAQLFSPAEIIEYFDKLATQAVGEEEKAIPLPSERMVSDALRFVRSFAGAIKVFHLYPLGSMRASALAEALSILEPIWQESEVLRLSEAEKNLTINGLRIFPKALDQPHVENVVNVMMEYSIKALSFKKGVSLDELNKFLEHLSSTSASLKDDKEGWPGIIKKEGIKCISIEDMRFSKASEFAKEFEKKDKIKDIMLMEFLLGKMGKSGLDKKLVINKMEQEPEMFARTIQEAAQEAVKEDKGKDEVTVVTESIENLDKELAQGGDPKKLARVILEINPELRNKVIRSELQAKEIKQKSILAVIPEEAIVSMLVSEYVQTQGNLLVVKGYFDRAFLHDASRRQKALEALEQGLLQHNADRLEVSFINGQLEWEKLSLSQKLNTLTALPESYYCGELEKIQSLLNELYVGRKKQELEHMIRSVLTKISQLDPFARKNVQLVIVDFIKSAILSDTSDVLLLQESMDCFLKGVMAETKLKVFTVFLDVAKEVSKEVSVRLQLMRDIILEIEKPQGRRYSLFIRELIFSLAQRLTQENSATSEIYKSSENFVKEIAQGRFLEVLLYSIINVSAEEKKILKSVYPLIRDRAVDMIINLQIQKDIKWGDSFHEYSIKKGSADFLCEFGEPAFARVRERLLRIKDDVSLSLIEFARYLHREELLEPLAVFTHHKDPLIRRSVILAIGSIGGSLAADILSQAAKEEKDKRLRQLIKDELNKVKTKR